MLRIDGIWGWAAVALTLAACDRSDDGDTAGRGDDDRRSADTDAPDASSDDAASDDDATDEGGTADGGDDEHRSVSTDLSDAASDDDTTAGADASTDSGAMPTHGDGTLDDDECTESSRSGIQRPFELYFTEPMLASLNFEATCSVGSIAGNPPTLLELNCELEQVPPFDSSTEVEVFVQLERGDASALAVGMPVTFRHGFLPGFNTENYAYAVATIEATHGYDAGTLLLGGLHADAWGGFDDVLRPLSFELGPALCVDAPTGGGCVERTYHDLEFSHMGQEQIVRSGHSGTLQNSPPLEVYVGNARVSTLVDDCCFDCEDDLVVFAFVSQGSPEADNDDQPDDSQTDPTQTDTDPTDVDPTDDNQTDDAGSDESCLSPYRDATRLPFELYFSEPGLAKRPFEAECVVDDLTLSIDAWTRSDLIVLDCELDEGGDTPTPAAVQVVMRKGRPYALAVGMPVHFSYSWQPYFNTPSYAYLISATDATSGYASGTPLVGGLYANEWRLVVDTLAPLQVELGAELCVRYPAYEDEFDCVRRTFYELDFEYQGIQDSVDSFGWTIIDGSPQLTFYVSNAIVRTLEDACCFDCDDDLIVFGFWADEPNPLDVPADAGVAP